MKRLPKSIAGMVARRKLDMLFFVNSRMCKGTTRDKVVEHFTQDWDPETWELVKKGTLAHWYYKVGDQPGIIALINCKSLEEARKLVDDTPVVKEGLLEFDINPVNQFPRFD
jgi:hypothetical protein